MLETLFPNKMAIRATKENKQVFEKQKEELQKANLKRKNGRRTYC